MTKRTGTSIMSSSNEWCGCGSHDHYNPNYDGYEDFLPGIQKYAKQVVRMHGTDLFYVGLSKDILWKKFIKNIPREARQHYNCHACRRFIQKYGNVVLIKPNGAVVPLLWDINSVPSFFIPAVGALYEACIKANVNGVFYSYESVWGEPVTGGWHHMNLRAGVLGITSPVNRRKDTEQLMAEKLEEFKMIMTVLDEYDFKIVKAALSLLQTGSLSRSEKVMGPAQWLYNLYETRNNLRYTNRKRNTVWRYIAKAKPGFAHVRTSMLGTVLADLKNGDSFQDLSKKFASKMEGTKYQRPKAAPKAGNILRARQIVEELDVEGALLRRFATIDEVHKIWVPSISPVKGNGVTSGIFSNVKPRQSRELCEANFSDVPEMIVTGRKFVEEIIPHATEISMWMLNDKMNFVTLTTCSNIDARPILQWDNESRRNPFSGYVYQNGSMPTQFNLNTNSWVFVEGICRNPAHWHTHEYKNQADGLIFLLEDCRDKRYKRAGLCIFPETLKSDFREVRQVIEAYSREGTLDGYHLENHACGVRLDQGQRRASYSYQFRVSLNGATFKYKIDRWD